MENAAQAPSSTATVDDSASERRRRRSDDPLVALHYQLSSARARGELDAIVLADRSGVVVAGAGSWPACEELAAYAPLLADAAWANMTDAVSSRVEDLRRDAIVVHVSVAGQEVLLCARPRRIEGKPGVAAGAVDAAAVGVSRILTAAAA
jgi:hypothetical protein